MLRRIVVILTYFSLLTAWVTPCLDATDALTACEEDRTSLVCDNDSEGESTGNPADAANASSAAEEEVGGDHVAKESNWLLNPFNYSLGLQAIGLIEEDSFHYVSIYLDGHERPPRV